MKKDLSIDYLTVKMHDIPQALKETTGLTKYFIEEALKQPKEFPVLKHAKQHTKIISFEGLKCSGKDYLIEKLTESGFKTKPKFKKLFPYRFIKQFPIYGGITDTLLLASAYAYDSDKYKDKSVLQNRGVFTFFTLESLRLSKLGFKKNEIITFLRSIIELIGIPKQTFFLNTSIELIVKRSKPRHKLNPKKDIIEGIFLEEQQDILNEYK